jgi:hypothetical protein
MVCLFFEPGLFLMHLSDFENLHLMNDRFGAEAV